VAFAGDELQNRLRLIASPDGAEGSVKVFQDVRIYAARLDAGREVQAALLPDRAGYVQVTAGTVSLNGTRMNAGDGARIEGESSITVAASAPAELLFFDLA
jgi:redox-sensitive bicupin YhaK (pirin superfamily)